MEVTCPNPGCAAVYTVGPQHLGKSFSCRACGTMVSVNIPVGGTTGPVPLGGGSAVPVNQPTVTGDPKPSPTSADSASPGRAIVHRLAQVRPPADPASWLLGAGVILSLICMFFPVLDSAKAMRLRAKIDAGDRYQTRADRDLNNRVNQGGVAPTAEEQNARKKAHEEWQKSKVELEDEAADAANAAGSNWYWNTWGMLLGSLLVAVAAMNYLASGQTRTRRVVGGVLICFVVMLVLATFNLLSVSSVLKWR